MTQFGSRWLPNIEEFLESLLRLMTIPEVNFTSSSYDSCEFLFRRLDAYERTLRTLSTLLLRVTETFGSMHHQSQPRVCIQQLSYILDRTTRSRVHFKRICSLSRDREGKSVDTVLSYPSSRRNKNSHKLQSTKFQVEVISFELR